MNSFGIENCSEFVKKADCENDEEMEKRVEWVNENDWLKWLEFEKW